MVKKVLTVGQEQEFLATIHNAATGEKILGALFNYKIISPSGSSYAAKGFLTDEKGSFSFKHGINEINEVGKYSIVYWVSKEGYEPKARQEMFETVS